MKEELTLAETLAEIGVSYSRTPNTANTGKMRLFKGDNFLGEYTAHEAWEHIQQIKEDSGSICRDGSQK